MITYDLFRFHDSVRRGFDLEPLAHRRRAPRYLDEAVRMLEKHLPEYLHPYVEEVDIADLCFALAWGGKGRYRAAAVAGALHRIREYTEARYEKAALRG